MKTSQQTCYEFTVAREKHILNELIWNHAIGEVIQVIAQRIPSQVDGTIPNQNNLCRIYANIHIYCCYITAQVVVLMF